ncbi:MAG: hypothetical protein RLZZ219_860 [Cyanobacteriota bacterium]|jgi:predicted Zn-dependent protease
MSRPAEARPPAGGEAVPGRGWGRGRARPLALTALLLSGGGLAALLWSQRASPPLKSSLARPFQLIGTPIQLVDRLASRLVPVGAVEEQQLGAVYHQRYAAQLQPGDPTQAYLDRLMARQVTPHTRRALTYRAYRIGRLGAPNAMALPGGVILVSDELLELVRSEAELVAILAHEAGHIELEHCFDQVRFELLLRHSGAESLGWIADRAIGVLLQRHYSKTAEQEADDHGYRLLLESPYDPAAMGRVFAAFNRLRRVDARPSDHHADLLRDYLASHPPGPLRQAEYEQRAAAWWAAHRRERRYLGVENLRRRRSLAELERPEEWARGAARGAQAAR